MIKFAALSSTNIHLGLLREEAEVEVLKHGHKHWIRVLHVIIHAHELGLARANRVQLRRQGVRFKPHRFRICYEHV